MRPSPEPCRRRQTKLIKAMRPDSPALNPAASPVPDQRRCFCLGTGWKFCCRLQIGLRLVARAVSPSPWLEASAWCCCWSFRNSSTVRSIPCNHRYRVQIIIDHHDAAIWVLDENLARGHQNSEVGDQQLAARSEKSLPKLLFEESLDGVLNLPFFAPLAPTNVLPNAINSRFG